MGSDVITDIFQDILQMELAAKGIYESLSGKAPDRATKAILSRIAKDEARHAENVRKVLSILGTRQKP